MLKWDPFLPCLFDGKISVKPWNKNQRVKKVETKETEKITCADQNIKSETFFVSSRVPLRDFVLIALDLLKEGRGFKAFFVCI